MRKKIAIVAVLVAVTVAAVWLAETRNHFFDSRVYAGAVRYWFRDGGMVYDWMRPGTPYGFTYPPFAGLVMAPMAYLPMPLILIIATLATVATTGLVVWWLAAPMIRRQGWTPWFAAAVAVCLAIVFEPVRETITFGQVNTVLLALVAADLLIALPAGRRWAGVGIGLATAIKLTPGLFIVYLLVTRRWRAAFTAMGTAAAVTLFAAALFPDESREFWTAALWDTDRVGVLSYLSNQSLRGFLARLPVEPVAAYLWIALVLAVLAGWARRVRRAPGDTVLGLALTGVAGTLISPVSWVHHWAWLLPALIRCADLGGRRVRILAAGIFLVLTSHLLWVWEPRPRPPLELLGSNLYVYAGLALLLCTPARRETGEPRSGSPHVHPLRE